MATRSSPSGSAPPQRADASSAAAPVPRAFHVAAALWVAAALAYAWLTTWRLPLLTEEDGLIEWWTVALFITAALVGLQRAWRDRRWFDLLVALFCLFVAGEEISWGQRLIGYTPPEMFLEHNRQQEFNLHNMVPPRVYFSGALLGFGVLMPLAWRGASLRRLMRVVGATPPPVTLMPWAIAAVMLTQWDPHKVTSEWAEGLAAAVFLTALWPDGARRARVPLAAVAAAALLTAFSTLRGGDADQVACAAAETQALLRDVTTGTAAAERLRTLTVADKSIWQAATSGELRPDGATTFRGLAPCRGERDSAERRRYAVDPWGVSYRIAIQTGARGRRVAVYSYGPNRRADGRFGSVAGDDVVAVVGNRQ